MNLNQTLASAGDGGGEGAGAAGGGEEGVDAVDDVGLRSSTKIVNPASRSTNLVNLDLVDLAVWQNLGGVELKILPLSPHRIRSKLTNFLKKRSVGTRGLCTPLWPILLSMGSKAGPPRIRQPP